MADATRLHLCVSRAISRKTSVHYWFRTSWHQTVCTYSVSEGWLVGGQGVGGDGVGVMGQTLVPAAPRSLLEQIALQQQRRSLDPES